MRAILVSHLLGLWRRVRPLGERLEAQAKELAREGGLPGWHLKVSERRLADGEVTFDVLLDRFDGRVAERACHLATSLADIRAALKDQVAAGTLERTLAEVLEEVNKAGGIKFQRSETLVRL